jgi:hypothetical protein
MNFKATVKGIAASGGTRPDGHITACPVTAIKAGPVAHTLTGQRKYTDERLGLGIPVGATSRSGGRRLKPCEELQSSRADYNLGNPCAEKVRPHRARQSSAPVGHRQGTLTITGSNVRLGTEMPVALSSFCK